MSHFTRVKTRMTDAALLGKALTDLGYDPADGAIVRGYLGQTTQADLVVRPGGTFDIGFVRAADGAFQVVADWWGVQREARLTEATFVPQVVQRYAYHTVLDQAARQGFQVVQETVGADRGIKLTIRRWQ